MSQNIEQPSSNREREIFLQALEKSTALERAAFLDVACRGDAPLRAAVDALLANANASLLDQVAAEAGPTQIVPFTEQAGDRIGRYKLLQRIGEGGMGVVYMAEQEEPVRRQVALKIIKLGMDTRSVVARFEAERQALALMDHPNIAKVLDAGATETGRPYFAMELVRGVPITTYCDKNHLGTAARLDLFIQVCHAIQHAHQKGVIHRDIKPSNVMVTLHDGVPVPRVIDFGVAKATGQRLTEKTLFTNYATMIGTPAYMSPEQAEMSGLDIDTRTDVYALGVLLYELLTGTTPFPSAELLSKGYGEMQRIIAEIEPARPSTRLSTMQHEERTVVAKNRGTDESALGRGFKGDLDWIVMKCLEKDRTRRYETASGLAADLKRHLGNEPVVARPPSAAYRFQKLARRNKLAFAAAGAVAAALVVGLAVAVTGLARERRAKVRAVAAEREQNRLRVAAERAQANEAEQRALAVRTGLKARQDLYATQMKLAHAALQAGKAGSARQLLQSLVPAPSEPDYRGFDWRFLHRLCQSRLSDVLATNAAEFAAVDWSPDGRALALGTHDGTVELFDVRTRRRLQRWQAHEGVVSDLAFCPRNPNCLATIGAADGLLKLWDVARTRAVLTTNGSKGFVPFVAFSPLGGHLASSAPDMQSLNLWNFQYSPGSAPPTLTQRTNLPSFGPAAFSPDEHLLAFSTFSTAGSFVALYDLSAQTRVDLPVEHDDLISAVAFSPDGRWLATGGVDERAALWDVAQRKLIASVTNDLIAFTSLTFAPNGQALYLGAWDQNLFLWDLANRGQLLPMRGHRAGVDAIALSPDGALLASAGRDGTARLWDVQSMHAASHGLPAEFTTLLHFNDTKGPTRGLVGVNGVAVSPDQSKAVAIGCTKLFLCDLATGGILATASSEDLFPQAPVFASMSPTAFSPDGRTLAVGNLMGSVALLDAVSLRPIQNATQRHSFQLSHTAFGLDGTVLITGGGFNADIMISDFPGGGVRTNIAGMEGGLPVQVFGVSTDGKLMAAGSPEHYVRIWDLATLQVIKTSPLKVRVPHCLAFSPDGRWLAIADELGAIFLWDYRGDRPIRKRIGHASPVLALAFTPDGRTLASGSTDHTIKLWHPDIDQEVATLTGHAGWIWGVTFAEQGNALVSGSRDGTLRVWRATSFEEMAAAEPTPNRVPPP